MTQASTKARRIGLASIVLSGGGYSAMRLKMRRSDWQQDCDTIANQLGIPNTAHPAREGAYRYVVYAQTVGTSHPFGLLGRQVLIWVIQHGHPDGTPSWSGYTMLMLKLADQSLVKVRLNEINLAQDIHNTLAARHIPRSNSLEYWKQYTLEGEAQFRLWWSKMAVRAHELSMSIETA